MQWNAWPCRRSYCSVTQLQQVLLQNLSLLQGHEEIKIFSCHGRNLHAKCWTRHLMRTVHFAVSSWHKAGFYARKGYIIAKKNSTLWRRVREERQSELWDNIVTSHQSVSPTHYWENYQWLCITTVFGWFSRELFVFFMTEITPTELMGFDRWVLTKLKHAEWTFIFWIIFSNSSLLSLSLSRIQF